MSKQNIQKVYPLTPMQEGMLYHSELNPDTSTYFTQLEVDLKGDLDMSILKKSIDKLVLDHDILRTVFIHQKLERPRQVVFVNRELEVHFEDIMKMTDERQEQYLTTFKRENQAKGFELARDQLFRVAVFQLAKDRFRFIWCNHHILMDGWSLGILMKQLFQNYEAYRNHRDPVRISLLPYSDYIKWLENQDKMEALTYWENRLSGFEESTSLPAFGAKLPEEPYQNEQEILVWDEQLVRALTKVASQYQVTIPNLFQSIWGALLAKYSNTEDVVFGTVVSGRPTNLAGVENMVGLFINTIPVRMQVEQNATFADLLQQTQQDALQAEKYDYVPLYEIQNRTKLNQHLVNHLLAFENYPLDKELEKGDFEKNLGFTARVVGAYDETNYDFNLIVFPGHEWTIKFMYNGSVYQKQWIEKIAGHLTNMARVVAADSEVTLDSLSILSDCEREEILQTFNDTSAAYPESLTIHQLFEEQVRQHPNHVALVFGNTEMTYQVLNDRANRIARLLRAKGVGPDSIVAIMVERSLEMIVGMLAILKAGGAYLPVDPAYPEDRIRFMLGDSGTKWLLTRQNLAGRFQFAGETLDLGEITNQVELADCEEGTTNLPQVNSPGDLCYIIYTSGTTGRPKGVMTTHRNVVRLLFNDRQLFEFGPNDTWTMFHSFCFDFSVWEMYGALLNGGKLVIVPKHVAQLPVEFRELLILQQVTVLNQTPTAFASLVSHELLEPKSELCLRYVIFGGEALQPLMLKNWRKKYSLTKLINMYGITETTVHVTYKEIVDEDIERNISNIGRPIPTLSCYIMDRKLNLLPVGVVGELCVSGLGVARGYLHRPELTAQRFCENPYKPGEVLYRSGDLARFLPNGEIEYFGRIDHQVKIRGFRIELGEIEHQLLKQDSIREAFVMARRDNQGDQYLCAYVVADGEINVHEVRSVLVENLPDYMVPAHILQLEIMPRTDNGKLDRRALPEPVVELDSDRFVAPTRETEQLLVEIWQDVLGVDGIGIDDNFFAIGGHSLKAMLLATKIHQQTGQTLPIKVLFDRPTIRELAVYFEVAAAGAPVENTTFVSIEPAEKAPSYPVSAAQRRMYILNQLGEANTSYNLPAVLKLEGELDVRRLESAFSQLIDRHEILRTSFEMADGTLVQKVHDSVAFTLNRSSAKNEELSERIQAFVRPFDLSEAPLVRAELVDLGESRFLLLIDMHHIISDGSSTEILVRDLTQLYQGYSLEEPKLHYKDFAVWQNSPHVQEHMKELEKYWLDSFSGELPVLELPTDYARPAKPDFTGNRLNFHIDGPIVKQIDQITEQTGTTLFMFLVSAFSVFLSRYTVQEDVVIGSPVAGRTHAQVRGIPGMFVNTVALRCKPAFGKSFRQLLLEVKDVSLGAYEHQDYPFEKLVDKLPMKQDTSRNPLFSVMFNLLNMDAATLKLDHVDITPYPFPTVSAKFDLTLEAARKNREILLAFDYAAGLFREETIKRWSQHLMQLVQVVVDNPDILLGDIDFMTNEEAEQILTQSCGTGVSRREDQTIHGRFEEMVQQMPDNIAVVDEKMSLTYRELDERANRLANALHNHGVNHEDSVALFMDRSVDTIVAIFAVMKAGGAYVPIDIDNPDERIHYMLQNSQTKCVVTRAAEQARLQKLYKGDMIDMHDIENTSKTVKQKPAGGNGSQLAYIIYTSGTTGQPKGVLIEHRQVLHLIEGLHKAVYSKYEPEALRCAMVAPFHFDASVQQIFATLLLGHTLFIVPRSTVVDGHALANYYRINQIDVTDGTPLHTQMLVAAGNLEGVRVRHMLIGGAALSYETVRALHALYAQTAGHVPIVTNVYGPTECCVDATSYDVIYGTEDACTMGPYVPIGQPVGNNRLYVLSSNGKFQPPLVPGELFIAGDGVGRGYLGLPELTAGKFISDPFFKGQVMYKTGDLARRRQDGTIEFLGRMDRQVKIRGYRIELGEIENVLLKIAMVDNAVVTTARIGGAVELCAYYTTSENLSVSDIREQLARKLPKYMVPAYLVEVESIPLTSNGKVDYRALPKPEAGLQSGTAYAPPTNKTEEQLCLLWQSVLGVEQVGIDDDFFELGGHSLKAMTFIGNIRQTLGWNISLKTLFEHSTIRDFVRHTEIYDTSISRLESVMKPVENRPYYPVSPAQNRMYILNQIESQGITYNIPAVLLLEGKVNYARLRHALQALVDRHEILRTSFAEVDGVPVQKIEESVEIDFKVREIQENEAIAYIRRFIRPFNLAIAPLFRAELLRLSDRKHLLLLDVHHIISDGSSNKLFVKEIAELYRGSNPEKPGLQYKDYSVWLTGQVSKERMALQEQYWLSQFKDDVQPLCLPLDFPRPPVQNFAGDIFRFRVSPQMVETIHSLIAQTGTTFHMVMLAAMNVLLGKLSGQEDIVIGTAVAGRTHADIQDMPGMFVNSLALRNSPTPDKTFLQFLQEVKETSLRALDNQDYPFEELVGKLDLQRDLSQNPLFCAMLTVENANGDSFDINELHVQPYDFATGISKFDLTLGAFDGVGEIELQFEYATGLFKRETIERWSHYLLNIFSTVVKNPTVSLKHISLLTQEERHKQLNVWNRKESDAPVDKTIHQLFEEKVRKTPDNAAVTFQGMSYKYKELNLRANHIAHILITNGIRPDEPVGIMVRPSPDMVTGALAILKAGAAFVPIDASYPEERIAYMLQDCNAKVLLTQEGLSIPAAFTGKVLLLTDFISDTSLDSSEQEACNPETTVNANHLAYIIYTSGTTGRPKGVMVEHQSLVNLCWWHNREFNVCEQDRSAKYAGFGFDASVWDIFPYLIAGANIHIIEETMRLDVARLNEYFEHNKITIAFFPTQLCETFIEQENHSLRVLLTGGDKLKHVYQRGQYRLVNNYGPTEGTVVATSTTISPGAETPPIGRPILGVQAYVLGAGDTLQPVGVAGELCIGGRGLARGYMNLAEETAKKFVPNPFQPGKRMYRTGDLVRWNEDGQIEYIGRIDQQVKIRGYRIELSEIEVQLTRLPQVQAAVVTDVHDASGSISLCAYIVPAGELSVPDLKRDLARALPDYMVPQYFVTLDRLPLTSNGKVNRKALPKPEMEPSISEYKAPETEAQKLLAGVWQEVLGITRVGTNDNFFVLGGDSIKAIQTASRLRKQGWKLEMKDLFQHPTVEGASLYLQRVAKVSPNQDVVEGDVPLGPIQSWFFKQNFTDAHHFNQAVMLYAQNGFDEQYLKQTVSALVLQHDALRMVFDGVRQINYGPNHDSFILEVVDLQDTGELGPAILQHANQIQESIDLKNGPLLKVVLYRTRDGDHLLFVIHHLVVDGVSWRIILEDFASGYSQAEAGHPITLGDKSTSFKQWNERLNEYADSESCLREIGFWAQMEQQHIALLPKDNTVANRRVGDAKAVSIELSESETELLLTTVHSSYGTEINDILLCALGLTVKEWTKETKVCINMEGHGREEVIEGLDISRTVGWFTSQYPFVLNVESDDLPTLIKTVKEDLRKIPNKGIGYGILRYLTHETHTAGIGFSMAPEISFNYLGQFGSEVRTSLYEPSVYEIGNQISPGSEVLYTLNLTGLVQQGRFVVTCLYDGNEYLLETIEKRMNSFKFHLLALIQHCAGKKDRDYTPSDFTADDLSMDEVGDIFDLLSEKLQSEVH